MPGDQADLFATLNPPCGHCLKLGAAIESGVRYCHGFKMWRWADERVDCHHRSSAEPASASVPGIDNKADPPA